ncbi:MAG: hypothetical protein WKG00_38190 [Polyangiaceae bacterium]
MGALVVAALPACGAADDGATGGDEADEAEVGGSELGAAAWTVTATLDKSQYASGEAMTLTVDETLVGTRTTQVADSGGATWSKQSDNGKTMVWKAVASGAAGSFKVTVTVKPAGAAAQSASDTYARGSSAGPRWPGHQPGKIYLGMSALTAEWQGKLNELLPQVPGVRRKFYEWNDASAENTQIASDHAAGRIPWMSFKPPGSGSMAQRWGAVAAGAYDADIRARANRYASLDQPVISTFHHEPSNDASEADGVQWANAWAHIYDVMEDETGLANVAFVPIIGEWLFNPKNGGQDPANWVKPNVISRQPFMGVDLYETGSGEGFEVRLGRIIDWLGAHGDPDAMVGIGETGCTDLWDSPDAVQWWNTQWAWATAHTDRIGVISYFNSSANSKPDHEWPLDESPAKLAAFKASLASPTATMLP